MNKKTDELGEILKNASSNDFGKYVRENKDELYCNDKSFEIYMKEIIFRKGLQLKDVFLGADISEKYGYKLLSGEKHTIQRDVILRICYAAKFSYEETQRALKLYHMPELYPRLERDALLIICFNNRPGSIIEVNELLSKNKFDMLRSSGVQD